MKPKHIAFVATIALSISSAHAADRWWDGATTGGTGDGASDGGAATWDTTTLNWDQGTGSDRVAWNNATNDVAFFAGTAGTVSLAGTSAGDVTVGMLDITGAYTIALKDSYLTISGFSNTLRFNGAATISATTGGKIIVGDAQTWGNSSTTTLAKVTAPIDTGANLLTLSIGNNNLDVTGKISGSGGLTVNSITDWMNVNSNDTTLNATNDYTGPTTINGAVYLGTGGLAELGADPSDIYVTNGGFRMSGTGTITRNLVLTGSCGIAKTSGTTTVNGVISGSGGLGAFGNFTSGAVVILGGDNTFSGDCTMFSDITLRLTHANAVANSTLTGLNAARSTFDLTTSNLAYVIGGIKGTGDLNLGTGLGTSSGTGSGSVSFGNNNQDNTYFGSLSGSAGVTKIGSGTQTFAGASTYTGPTAVNAGKLVFVTGGQVGNSNFTVADTATLGVMPLIPNTQLNVKSLTLGSGTATTEFNFTAALPSTSTAPLQVNGNLINNGTLNAVITGGAFVAGGPDFPLIKYTGSLTLGTLGTVTMAGGAVGTLVINPGNKSIDLHVTAGNQLVWSAGTGTWDINTTANWDGGTKTYLVGNSVLLDDSATGTGPFTVTVSSSLIPSFVTVNNATKNYAFTGGISGATGLLKSGAAKLTLSSTNTYTGLTTVAGGTLAYGVTSALSSGPVTVNGAGATLDMVTFNDTVGTVTLDGGGQIIGTNTVTGLASTNSFEMINGSVNALLSGNGVPLNKTGAGTVTLNKANSYTGLTTVTAGTLAYGISNAISNGGITVNGASAILNIGAFSDSVNMVTLSGGGQINGTTGVLTTTSSFEMMDGTVSAILAGNLNTRNLNKTTAGTVTLSGANTLTGSVSISAGILKLGAAGDGTNSPLGTSAAGTTVNATGGALDLNGFSLSIAEPLNLKGTGVSSGGALMNSSATAATYSGLVTLGAASSIVAGSGDIILSNPSTITGAFGLTLDGTATGSRIDSNIGTGIGSLTKIGAGTWTLNASNNYTGATNVNAGTLAINGTSVGSAVTVAAGATLGGTGTIGGNVSVSGKIAPGLAATGTLLTGNVTFTATGEYACTINGADSDVLDTLDMIVDPAAKITLSGTPTEASYVIALYQGAEPTHFDEGSLPFGYKLDYSEPGVIKLVQNAGGGTPFQTWAAGGSFNLTGSNALAGADPDGDGVKNIAEFALGGNPIDGSKKGNSLAKVQNNALTLTFLTRSGTSFDTGISGPRTAIRDGVTYSVQGSQNLSSWTATITEIANPAGMPLEPSGYEYHTFRTAGPVSSTAKDFIRVQVVGQ